MNVVGECLQDIVIGLQRDIQGKIENPDILVISPLRTGEWKNYQEYGTN